MLKKEYDKIKQYQSKIKEETQVQNDPMKKEVKYENKGDSENSSFSEKK